MKYAWVLRLRKGDVLKSRTGRLRVVRKVSIGRTVASTTVIFSIQHCSWTGRPYTVYTGNDLRQMGYRPTKARVRLNSQFARLLEADFGATRSSDCTFTCCDVEGIA